jgi:hypothetical protein
MTAELDEEIQGFLSRPIEKRIQAVLEFVFCGYFFGRVIRVLDYLEF